MGSRYYDPETGRFINTDDVSNLGANGDFASLNLYTCCGNNPVGRVDDEGKCWEVIAALAGRAAIGAAVNVFTTFVAAIVTGQEYTRADAAIAAGTGAANAICPIAAAIGGGIVTAVYSYQKGDNWLVSVIKGTTTGLSTYYSIGNLANTIGNKTIEKITPTIVSTAASDLSEGLGYALMSAGINRGAVELIGGKSSQISGQYSPETISSGAAPVVKPS